MTCIEKGGTHHIQTRWQERMSIFFREHCKVSEGVQHLTDLEITQSTSEGQALHLYLDIKIYGSSSGWLKQKSIQC